MEIGQLKQQQEKVSSPHAFAEVGLTASVLCTKGTAAAENAGGPRPAGVQAAIGGMSAVSRSMCFAGPRADSATASTASETAG